MDKSHNDSPYASWHVIGKLVKAFGGLPKVLEERQMLTQLRDLCQKEETDAINEILNTDMGTPNWENKIATLIGAARVHRSYREIFTIKEK